MEQSTKDLWIQKLKQGRVLVIQSALAPLKKDCLWFKNGALYVYGNRGWEALGVGDGGDEPTPEPEPEPEPSDRVYVPVPTELSPFESVTYEYDDHNILRGTEKSETREVETRTATISYVTVPDNAAGFEVTNDLCITILGTYESASEAKSTTPFGLYPYWERGLTPEELTSDLYYDHIVGIMTSLYGPDDYEVLHYDRFWDENRHFEAHTWTAKVFESGPKAKVEKTKLFVTVELNLEVVTIEDASIQIREPIA